MPRNKSQFFQISKIDLNAVVRQPDGSIVLNAGAFKVGDYEHWGFETALTGAEYNKIYIGRIEQPEADKILNTFEGLALTKDHVWIEDLTTRKEYSVGAAIANAEMQGDIAMTRVLIDDAAAIAKVESGEYQELSIGFDYISVDVRGKVDGVDFLIKDIQLNHMALVKEGRAGKDARLYNHAKSKELKMAKVLIGGVEHDVTPEVAAHIASQATQLTQKGSDTVSKTEYDKIATQNTQLQAQVDTLAQQKGKDDITAQAAELAKNHAVFAKQMTDLGVDFQKGIGEYNKTDEMKAVLTKAGYTIPANPDAAAEAVYVQAMFDMAAQKPAQPSSAVQSMSFTKAPIQGSFGVGDNDIDHTNAASKAYFFGKGEAK